MLTLVLSFFHQRDYSGIIHCPCMIFIAATAGNFEHTCFCTFRTQIELLAVHVPIIRFFNSQTICPRHGTRRGPLKHVETVSRNTEVVIIPRVPRRLAGHINFGTPHIFYGPALRPANANVLFVFALTQKVVVPPCSTWLAILCYQGTNVVGISSIRSPFEIVREIGNFT